MKSLNRPLNYNENKIKSGDASLLLAANFLQEKEDLTFYDKRNRFENLMKLNARTKEKVVHFSLNFSPKDKIDQAELAQIAEDYMVKIGFGEQPYLVYQHFDAGHLHMHVVSTLIKSDGKRIGTHDLESEKSMAVCREMEREYGLVKAEKKTKEQQESITDDGFFKMKYGKHETKSGITKVLNSVVNQYNYTSLHELNAVLKLANVMADRGPETGVVYKTGGLYYRILNDSGEIVGKPIKASSIYSKPTLAYLEQRFAENKPARILLKKRVQTAIDWQLKINPKITLTELVEQLKHEKIHVVLRRNEQHLIYGITYVDTQKKAVFNGSELGKQYAAEGLLARLNQLQRAEPLVLHQLVPAKIEAGLIVTIRSPELQNAPSHSHSDSHHISPKAVYPGEYLPYELKNNRKKRKRRTR